MLRNPHVLRSYNIVRSKSDGQPISADFNGKVAAAHHGVLNADMLLKQFEQHKAGDLVNVRYVYSDVSDTYYLLGVVGATAD